MGISTNIYCYSLNLLDNMCAFAQKKEKEAMAIHTEEAPHYKKKHSHIDKEKTL